MPAIRTGALDFLVPLEADQPDNRPTDALTIGARPRLAAESSKH